MRHDAADRAVARRHLGDASCSGCTTVPRWSATGCSSVAGRPRSRPAMRVAKSVLMFLWFTLSLPLLQLDLDSSTRLLRQVGAGMKRWSTLAVIDAVTRRFGVLRTWAERRPASRRGWSCGAWSLSAVLAPQLPRFTDRAPPGRRAAVGGALRRPDLAHRLRRLPAARRTTRTRSRWRGSAAPRSSSARSPWPEPSTDASTRSAGGRCAIDGYNVIAPRLIDAIRAVDTAAASGADAIVVALNPAWVRSRVVTARLAQPRRLQHRHAVDAAVDVVVGTRADRPLRLRLAAVAGGASRWSRPRPASTRPRRRKIDWLDVLDDPTGRCRSAGRRGDRASAARVGHVAGRPLRHRRCSPTRTAGSAALIDGIGVSQHEAEFFAGVLLDTADDAGVPVFLYATPFAPESLADPAFDAAPPGGRGVLGGSFDDHDRRARWSSSSHARSAATTPARARSPTTSTCSTPARSPTCSSIGCAANGWPPTPHWSAR